MEPQFTKKVTEELGFIDAVYKGNMSTYSIDVWHEKNNFLECQDEKDGDGIIITYCPRTFHIWVKIPKTTSMYEHWISK
jgi:hypothetical protein